jgi:hypothetical protein
LRPCELALRDWVRPRLTPAVVLDIAGMDYGQQVRENRQAIEELLLDHRLPEHLGWPPRAVLELASHHRGDSPGEHTARLFSCLVLVRSGGTSQPAATLAALVESALRLGPEATEAAVRYLAWCRAHELGDWRDSINDKPFLTLGLLLAYLSAPATADHAVVSGLAAACVAEVQAAITEDNPWWPGQPPQGLLRKAAGGEGWRRWRGLAGRALPGEGSEAVQRLREWFTS